MLSYIQSCQPHFLKNLAVRASIGVLFCLAALSGTAAEGRLTVYAELEEPANFPDDSDNAVPVGPDYRVVRAILREAGLQADVNVVPWPRVIRSLESQANVLAFSMTRTPDREELYQWIGMIQKVEFTLWGLPERAAEFPGTLEAARNLRVSVIRDDVVEKYLIDNGFTNLVYFSESSNTLTMLRRDRVDLMPYIRSGIESYLARKNESLDAVVPVIDLEEISTGQYVVMSKQSDPELVRLLQDSYQAVVDRGDLDDILIPAQN